MENSPEVKNEGPGLELKGILKKWYDKMILIKPRTTLLLNDIKILLSHKYGGDSNETAIDKDIERTRGNEIKDFPSLRADIKKILIFYCHYNGTQYKQGMNEIIALFYLLKKYDDSVDLLQIFNVFSMFLDLYFTNYFYFKNIDALHSSLAVIDLLLKYHEPEIYNHFNRSFATAQVYATNWLITTGAK